MASELVSAGEIPNLADIRSKVDAMLKLEDAIRNQGGRFKQNSNYGGYEVSLEHLIRTARPKSFHVIDIQFLEDERVMTVTVGNTEAESLVLYASIGIKERGWATAVQTLAIPSVGIETFIFELPPAYTRDDVLTFSGMNSVLITLYFEYKIFALLPPPPPEPELEEEPPVVVVPVKKKRGRKASHFGK